MRHVHNSVDFFIDGKMIKIRPFHSDEPYATKSITDLTKLGYVPIGQFQTRPEDPLSDFCDDENEVSGTVFVALSEEDDFATPVGFALYNENKTIQSHEMAVLIAGRFEHTRLSYELARQLLEDAKNNGVKTVYTTDSNDDIEMRNVAKKLNMSVRLAGKYRTTRYSLQTDEHPWIVEVG